MSMGTGYSVNFVTGNLLYHVDTEPHLRKGTLLSALELELDFLFSRSWHRVAPQTAWAALTVASSRHSKKRVRLHARGDSSGSPTRQDQPVQDYSREEKLQ